MPEEQDNVVTEEVAPESEASAVNGTEEETSTDSVAAEAQQQDEESEAEKLRKENNKLQMELNLRRKREKELEEAKKQAELKALEDQGEYKTVAEKLQEELAAYKKKEEEQTINGLRDSVLNEFPKEVADAARDLDLWWGEAETTDDAQEQLRTKLQALAKRLVVEKKQEDDEEITVHPNNPNINSGALTEAEQLAAMSVDELRKILPKADSR